MTFFDTGLALLVVVAIASCLAVRCAPFMTRLPWTDEVLTLKLAHAMSYRHMLDAVYRGIDATPPLYTTFARLLVWFSPDQDADLVVMRSFNLGLMLAGLLCIFVMIRAIRGASVAALTTLLFIFVAAGPLLNQIVEIRTYALLFFAVTLSLAAATRYVGDERQTTAAMLAAAFVLVVASHTLGIVYVAAIDLALFVTLSLGTTMRQSARVLLIALPAALVVLTWLPVVRHQSGLGNWIGRPEWSTFLSALWLYEPGEEYGHWVPNDAIRYGLPVIVLLTAARFLLQLRSSETGGFAPFDRARARALFGVIAAALFVGATLTLWVFARAVFPIFIKRYFFPNILIHLTWLCVAADLLLRVARAAIARRAVVLLASLLVWLKVDAQPVLPANIRCLDAMGQRFLESGVPPNVVVTASLHGWFPRWWSGNGTTLIVSDDDSGSAAQSHVENFRQNFLAAVKRWQSLATIAPLHEILQKYRAFYMLDDGSGDLPNRISRVPGMTVTPIAKTSACTLSKVDRVP